MCLANNRSGCTAGLRGGVVVSSVSAAIRPGSVPALAFEKALLMFEL
jgi:hypothetical protein